MIPEARIIYAHGQMNKSELENIMADFIDYKYDILICTTIIETGIDIPNANTLMVFDSDRFGLSQLYQLRGRVGRSNRIAYAYLMYNKNKMLNDIAIKRLQAIKEFTELGSGYRIAMRDLALRGAGDVLGSEQAGFVSDVGLDLYMKLVDEEIRRINGEEIPEEDESNKSLVDVETHISDSYVSDEDLKIEIHQKINEIDSYDKLVAIKDELEDRFGKINDNIEIYMYEEWFEKIALKLNIKNVKQNDHFVEVTIPSEIVEKVKFDKIFMEAYEICSKFSFKNQHGMVIITLSVLPLKKHFIYYLVALFNLILEEYQKNS
jgi:transcription-repair coupling factor (superfamily II helicase)